ncbi:MAG: response regulator [Anaerolineae bacterium]|nr:response regulator [Anaerolineae bacterium]
MKPWMVVEDELDIRNIIKVLFEAWGRGAMEFRDGNETFKWLDAVESGNYEGELPDLALMDIRMPGHFGNEIAHRMRTIPELQHIPIVLMTAFSLTDTERQSMMKDDGVDHIIAKPLPDMMELKMTLDDIYAKKKSKR